MRRNLQHFHPSESFNQSQRRRNQDEARDSYVRRLRALPTFNGGSYKDLIEFTEVADSIYFRCINDKEEREFYDQMHTQLRGESRNVALNMNDADCPEIKDKLLSYFGHLSNKHILTSQIENLHQEKDETLTQYADRARKLLTERNMTYHYLSEEQSNEHNRTARKA